MADPKEDVMVERSQRAQPVEPVEPRGVEDRHAAARRDKLSYKFQRLRERLRAAVESGELCGKLPGERQLARRFRVNAKTLSKALTDLAAEGLLERAIGRGTFVKEPADRATSARTTVAGTERWLIICDPEQVGANIIRDLCNLNPGAQVITDTSNLRPSFLNQFKGAVNFAWGTSDEFLRSLVVRNVNVVMVNREPSVFSMNAVLVDRALGASCLARDLMLVGHRRFLAVEKRAQTSIADAIRRTAQRYVPETTVDAVDPADVPRAVERGVTAVICGTLPLAVETRRALAGAGVEIPARASLACVGSGIGHYPCSGYYIHADQKADAILQLLRDPHVRRPATLWLTGAYHELHTTGPVQVMMDPDASRVHEARFGGVSAS
jgi:DNA-binding transcriptional regulator YhcF (GntR family)